MVTVIKNNKIVIAPNIIEVNTSMYEFLMRNKMISETGKDMVTVGDVIIEKPNKK
jgi:hypothetical protein